MADNPRLAAGETTVRRPCLEIQPVAGWQGIDLKELWQYRELLYVFVWRDIKVRYRQTLLGVIWVLGQPLIATLLFTLVFNRVAKIEAPSGTPYPVFALLGVVPWTFFANGVQNSANSLIGNTHLISKTYFPRLLVPIGAVLSGSVDFAATFLLIAVMLVWYGIVPSATVVLFPLVALLVVALASGLGFWLSALNVEYRDIRVVIPFLIQIGMYATPVVYPRELLPGSLARLAVLNPMTGIIETLRASLLGSQIPTTALAASTGLVVVILLSGALVFRRIERSFADLL